MAQIDNHLNWCLKNQADRLKKVKPDLELAKQHLEKSKYNANVMKLLEKSKKYDWALNVSFYATKHGYQSKNQSCSVTALLKLIEDKKLELDKDLILQFDTLDIDKEAASTTIRHSREISTYGVKTQVDITGIPVSFSRILGGIDF